MSSMDLNVVRTFVTVYETGSVTAAARLLHLTQPTVTHALNKLRRQMNDELFVRSRTGVTPTAVAVRAYPRFVHGLNAIDHVFQTTAPFDAAASSATFRIGMSDAGEVSVLPPLVAALDRYAPTTRLEVTSLDVDAIEAELINGKVDAFVSSAEFRSPRISRDTLFRERYAVLLAVDHPRIGSSVSDSELAAEPHIVVDGVTGHHAPSRMQRERGVNIRACVPRFTAVPRLVAQSDAVALVPHYIADLFSTSHAVRWIDLPWPLAPIEISIHARHAHSRSIEQNWLVATIIEAVGERRIDTPSPHTLRSELDTDARADGSSGLGDGVLPGALAGAAHHDEVPASEREAVPRGPASLRPEGQRSR